MDTVNRDPSDAIRMLIGPGFSSPQPHTSESRPSAPKRPKVGGKKIIKKKGTHTKKRRASNNTSEDQAPGWGSGVSHSNSLSRHPVDQRNDPLAAPVAPNAATQAQSCMSCGAHMGPENQFCGRCGNRMQPAQPMVPTCLRCGTKGIEGQRFCGSCGGAL